MNVVCCQTFSGIQFCQTESTVGSLSLVSLSIRGRCRINFSSRVAVSDITIRLLSQNDLLFWSCLQKYFIGNTKFLTHFFPIYSRSRVSDRALIQWFALGMPAAALTGTEARSQNSGQSPARAARPQLPEPWSATTQGGHWQEDELGTELLIHRNVTQETETPLTHTPSESAFGKANLGSHVVHRVELTYLQPGMQHLLFQDAPTD